jgi:2-polyprenyl-3-methyl-5-hydroxy-6-metoxy-1,4-benzoquinol methylase
MAGNLQPTACAICRVEGNASELYPANLSHEAFDPAVFSARRLPDRIHYRIVKCNTCGLVRSDPIAPSGELTRLYQQSTFDYQAETDNLKRTYGRYLHRLEHLGAGKGALLEIGCGNGFFLEEALNQGYQLIRGVEPSRAAIERAAPVIKENIHCGMMENGLFKAESFNVICLFQVIDHLPDPASVLNECLLLLRKGGLLLTINHNVTALSNATLKDRSPIIDIEHTYLFSPTTMRRTFEKCGYLVREQGQVTNDYSLHYLVRLFPLRASFKARVLEGLRRLHLDKIPVRVPLGNLYLVGQRKI